MVILTYALGAVFVMAFLHRAMKIAKLPMHLRWELAPVPHEKGRAHYGGSYFEEFEWWTKPREKSKINELVYMFKEINFFEKLWNRKHERPLSVAEASDLAARLIGINQEGYGFLKDHNKYKEKGRILVENIADRTLTPIKVYEAFLKQTARR